MASAADTRLRFVRCPKCHQLLVEYPAVPVYRCGGCGAFLKAKNQNFSVEGSPDAASVGKEDSLDRANAQIGDASSENKQRECNVDSYPSLPEGISGTPIITARSPIDDLEEKEKYYIDENVTDDLLREKENNKDDGVMDDQAQPKGFYKDAVDDLVQDKQGCKEENVISDQVQEKEDNNDKNVIENQLLQKQGCNDDNVIDQKVVDGEEMNRVQTTPSEVLKEELETKTLDDFAGELLSPATDESIKTCSHRCLIEELERSLTDEESTDIFHKCGVDMDDNLPGLDSARVSFSDSKLYEGLGVMFAKESRLDSHEQLIQVLETSLQTGEVEGLPSASQLITALEEPYVAGPVGDFGSNFKPYELHLRPSSLDSSDFQHMQNFFVQPIADVSSSSNQLQGDAPQNPANRSGKFERRERLKMIDDLRGQLSRLSTQPRTVMNSHGYLDERSHLRENYQPHPFQAQMSFHDTIGHQHVFPHCACTRCHHGHQNSHFAHAYSFADGADHLSYGYQPSFTGTAQSIDSRSHKSSFKMVPAVRKSILRPLSGAAPFIICDGCFQLLSMPSETVLKKRKAKKFRCGQCSKDLVLQPGAANSFAYMQHSTEPPVAENAGKFGIPTGFDIVSHSAWCADGDQVRISEEPDLSHSRSFAQGSESILGASTVSQQGMRPALHRLMGYSTMSRLLKHSRVFEDIQK